MSKQETKASRYEASAGRVQLISVRSTPSDDLKEWETIKEWLQAQGEGDIKSGIRALAIKNNIISEK